MDSRISLSIILPIYNPDISQLKECLDSIYNQEMRNFELIIINDSDNEVDYDFLLEKFDDIRVKNFKSDKSLGLAKSINFGIKNSSADFIARMDCDDICMPFRLIKQINFLKDNPNIDLVGSNCIKIDMEGNKIKNLKFPENHFDIKIHSLFFSPVAHSSIMVRRNFFSRFGYYLEDFSPEDLELWLRALSMGAIFHNLQEDLLKLRVINTNQSSRTRHWRANAFLRYKYFDFKFPIRASISFLLWSLVSLMPSFAQNFARKLWYKFR